MGKSAARSSASSTSTEKIGEELEEKSWLALSRVSIEKKLLALRLVVEDFMRSK